MAHQWRDLGVAHNVCGEADTQVIHAWRCWQQLV